MFWDPQSDPSGQLLALSAMRYITFPLLTKRFNDRNDGFAHL